MPLPAALDLLRRTRTLTVLVALLLSVQLFGNLYEELVTNIGAYADPSPGSVGELEPGSPLFFYLPWVPVGLVLTVVLVARLHRVAPPHVARRGRWALACLLAAMLSKTFLITRVNPEFRRDDIAAEEIREAALVWGVVNGVAIVAVAAALVLLLSWRPQLLDRATREEPARRPA